MSKLKKLDQDDSIATRVLAINKYMRLSRTTQGFDLIDPGDLDEVITLLGQKPPKFRLKSNWFINWLFGVTKPNDGWYLDDGWYLEIGYWK